MGTLPLEIILWLGTVGMVGLVIILLLCVTDMVYDTFFQTGDK